MRILGIDTSGNTIGISIVEDQKVLLEIVKKAEFRMVEEFFPLLIDVKNMGFDIEKVDGIGIVKGPGNFTSLRVGIAFAKILAEKNKIPVVGVVSLDALGFQMRSIERGIALIKAYGGLFYTAEYNYGNLCSEYSIKTIEEINANLKKNTGIAGNGMDYVDSKDVFRFEDYIKPSVVGFIAESYIKENKIESPALLSPFYLQKIKAEEKL